MARINIDDDVESRPEYRKLLKLVGGDDHKALGMLVTFWRLAQKYWGEGKLIPLADIEAWDFQPILESRWGIRKDDGIYAIGSEERFAWYRQRVEAGKKGGRPGKPDETGANREITGEPENRHSVNPLTLTPSPVPSLFLSLDKKKDKEKEKNLSEGQEVALAPSAPKELIARYCELFKARYGTNPPIQGKDSGAAKNTVKSIGLPRALGLIETYLGMNDSWFLTKRHDLPTFAASLNAIAIKHDTGKEISKTETRLADQSSHFMNQMERIRRGEL